MKKTSLLGAVIGLNLLIYSFIMPALCQGATPAAIYDGRLYPNGNPPTTIYVTHFGSYSSYWESNNRFATSNLFLSPGFPPRVTASSQVYENGSNTPIVWGSIKYFTRVSKKDPRVPDGTQVPLSIHIRAIVSFFCAPGSILPDGASATITFNNETLGYIYVTHYNPTILEKSLDVTVSRSVPMETDIPVVMSAGGGYTATAYNADGGIYAFADPVINIDPNAMVTVDGVSVPATQVLKLEFSPGFNPVADAAIKLLLID